MAVTGTIGDAEVRLENAAEEATMKKILEAINSQQSGGGSTSTSTNSGIGSIANLGKSANLAGLAFKGLGLAIGAAAGALKGLTGIGASAVSLGTSFIAAQPKITDFTAALEGLPWILGDFGKAIHAVTKLLYNNLTVFRQLTTSGIAFGDRLEQMTGYGANVGTSLNHLAGLLAENSNSFAFLGTATRGASMAIRANEEAFATNSRMLQAFGLSFEEQSEQFMRFFSLNSLGLARGTMTQDQLTDMSGQYIKQMRRLSELTGKQADELQAGIDRANMNRAFQNELAKLPADVRNRFGLIMNTVQEGFGDAGREAMMATMLGIAPVTDEAATMMSINRDFGALLNNLNTSARGFTGNIDAFGTMMYEQMRGFANTNRGYADGYSRFASALTMTNDPVGIAQSQLIYGINLFSGRIDEVASNLGKQSPLQRALNELEQIIFRLRKTFSDLFTTIISSEDFQKGLTALGDWLEDFNDEVKRQGLMNTIVDLFQDLMLAMKRSLNESGWMGNLMVRDSTIAPGSEQDLRSQITRDRELVLEEMAKAIGRGENVDTSSITNATERDLLVRLIDAIKAELRQQISNLGQNLEYAPLMMTHGITVEDVLGEDSTNQINKNRQTIADMQTIQEQLRDMQFSGGTPGRFGSVLHNFGRGTPATLHGKEAVLNDQQLYNLITGARLQGATSVATTPENLPNTGNFSKDLGNKIVDMNREHNVKLYEALNIVAQKIEQQNSLTRQVISTIQDYA